MNESNLRGMPVPFSRRELLSNAGYGLGAVALGHLLSSDGATAAPPKLTSGIHFPARAKRVISLFQSGAPSQVDLFDFKPVMRACILRVSVARPCLNTVAACCIH